MQAQVVKWVLLACFICCASAFPRYRVLLEAEDTPELPYLDDYEDDVVERRVLPELICPSSAPFVRPSKRGRRIPLARTPAPLPLPTLPKGHDSTAPLPSSIQPGFSCPAPNEPLICGNDSGALTITVSGPANNTKCTASQSLSDNGALSCEATGKVFGGDCDTYEGGLYINIGFVNPQRTINPDIQYALGLLGLGNLSYIGLLHVSIGGVGQQVTDAIDFLPSLQAIIGASNPNPSNGFTGAALYLSGSSGMDVVSLPSLTRLTDINGTTIIQDLALVNLTSGLTVLQIVEGDFVVENNPKLQSLAGTAQSLTTVLGQVYIANNPVLKSLSGANASNPAIGPGALRRVGGQLVIGGNAMLTSLAGLENLESVGGAITISQNNMLSNITALSRYAGCANNPTSQETPVPVFIQIVLQIQPGAPPITCILNNFVAICAYIKSGGCPYPDGTPAVISGGTGVGD